MTDKTVVLEASNDGDCVFSCLPKIVTRLVQKKKNRPDGVEPPLLEKKNITMPGLAVSRWPLKRENVLLFVFLYCISFLYKLSMNSYLE